MRRIALETSLGLTLVLVGFGCTQNRVVATTRADAGVDAGTQLDLERGWGRFAQSLPIQACDGGAQLVVDTLDDLLEGGPLLNDRSAAGATLSLREAIFLAANTPGPHRIAFDPRVFPAGDAAVIRVSDASLRFPNQSLQNTCIDARDRGVIVEFAFPAPCEALCMWSMGAGSQLTGLVIKGNAGKMLVGGALIAGNRFAVEYQALEAYPGAVIGPWNVFGHGDYGVRVDLSSPTPVRIEGNFFGVEPGTLENTHLTVSAVVFDAVSFTDNTSGALLELSGAGGEVSRNVFHKSRFDLVLTAGGAGWALGPGNIFEGGVSIVRGGSNGPGNRLFANTFVGEVFSDGLIAPPTDGGAGSITGDCPGAGTVEVYARADATWSAVGTAGCQPSQRWALSSSVLNAGLEARTLFTDALIGQTGPFSPALVVP